MAMELLFSRFPLSAALENHKRAAIGAVDKLSQSELLNSDEDVLKSRVLQKFKIDVPRLVRESIYVDEPVEIDVDVTGRWGYDQGDPYGSERPPTTKGTRVVIHIPFEGEAELFHCNPSDWPGSVPRARVGTQELLIEYELANSETQDLRQRYESAVSGIEQALATIRPQVEECLRELPSIVSTGISLRKARLQKGVSAVSSLGLPIKRSGD
jgi:hypothetical protein